MNVETMEEQTIYLSDQDAETLKAYAQEHGLTVDEVIQRFVESLRGPDDEDIHPEVQAISGLVPSDVDAEEEYGRYQLRKHSP